jgi:hypothetical protein
MSFVSDRDFLRQQRESLQILEGLSGVSLEQRESLPEDKVEAGLTEAFGPVSGVLDLDGIRIPVFRNVRWHKDEPIDPIGESVNPAFRPAE